MTTPGPSRIDVRVEPSRREMVVGALVVPIAPAGGGGDLRVGGDGGPVLRPLRFGERTRLAAYAARSEDPRGSLAASIARAATVVDGELDALVRETAALVLSGAQDAGASFGTTALRLARAAGWDLRSIIDAEAVEVDRLAAAAGAVARDAGWSRLLLGASEGDSLAALRDQLADTLLARVDGAGDVAEAAVDARDLAPDGRGGPARLDELAPRDDGGGAVRPLELEGNAPSDSSRVSGGRWRHTPTESAVIADVARVSAARSAEGVAAATERTAVAPAPGSGAAGVMLRASVGIAAEQPRPRAAAAPPDGATATRPAPAAAPDRLGLRAPIGVAPVAASAAAARASAGWGISRVAAAMPDRANAPAPAPSLDELAPDLADALALLLDEEADLRGLE